MAANFIPITRHSTRKASVAEASILSRYGADLIPESIKSSENCEGIIYNDWEFKSFHDKILDEIGMNQLARKISDLCDSEPREDDKISVKGALLHLPPMVFANDILNIKHIPSGHSICFDSGDALSAWALNHTRDVSLLEVIKVPYSQQWMENDLLSLESKVNDSIDSKKEDSADAEASINNGASKIWNWDWTFCSDYCFSLMKNQENFDTLSSRDILTASRLTNASKTTDSSSTANFYGVRMLACDEGEKGIDKDLLRQREDILFYDELLMYQVCLQSSTMSILF
jgi:hypothetical protein